MKSSKPGREKDGEQVDGVVTGVVGGDPGPGGDKYGSARMYDSYRISDMNAGGSGLKKKDFVGLGMAVNLDSFPDRNACSHENQMRGPAILRVNLQDESLSAIGMPGPNARFAALAFVLLEDESVALAKVHGLGFGASGAVAPAHTRRAQTSVKMRIIRMG